MAQKQMSNQHVVKRGRAIAKLRRANWERSGPVMSERRQLLEEICTRALETNPPASSLRQACLDDAMRIEVESLLASCLCVSGNPRGVRRWSLRGAFPAGDRPGDPASKSYAPGIRIVKCLSRDTKPLNVMMSAKYDPDYPSRMLQSAAQPSIPNLQNAGTDTSRIRRYALATSASLRALLSSALSRTRTTQQNEPADPARRRQDDSMPSDEVLRRQGVFLPGPMLTTRPQLYRAGWLPARA